MYCVTQIVCVLPKNYFYCPLPAWALNCGLLAGDCVDATSVVGPLTAAQDYVAGGCPRDDDLYGDCRRNYLNLSCNGYWACRVLACSPSDAADDNDTLAAHSCAQALGPPDCGDGCTATQYSASPMFRDDGRCAVWRVA